MNISKKIAITLFLSVISFNAICKELFLKDISGVNYLPPDENAAALGIGWVRGDLSWADVEKREGEYDWSKFDKLVLDANKQNLKVLPILAYTPQWTQSVSSKKTSPPNNYAAWLKFVKAAVGRYSKAPYNIKYFQIWNEPTEKAKFWLGSQDDYIDKLYIPAAKAIREQGGKVVFGGWPISNSIAELEKSLDHNNAWKYTDVIDFHYGPEKYYNHLYNKYLVSGKVDGLWQTELGYRSDKLWLSKAYIYILNWALTHSWDHPDKYKVFWFPAWANGKDTSKALLTVGKGKETVLTENGKALKTINDVFGNAPLKLFKGATPKDGKELFAFQLNDRVVLVPWFGKNSFEGNSLSFSYAIEDKTINSVTVIDSTGKTLPSSFDVKDKKLDVKVNNVTKDVLCEKCKADMMLYIVIR